MDKSLNAEARLKWMLECDGNAIESIKTSGDRVFLHLASGESLEISPDEIEKQSKAWTASGGKTIDDFTAEEIKDMYGQWEGFIRVSLFAEAMGLSEQLAQKVINRGLAYSIWTPSDFTVTTTGTRDTDSMNIVLWVTFETHEQISVDGHYNWKSGIVHLDDTCANGYNLEEKYGLDMDDIVNRIESRDIKIQ